MMPALQIIDLAVADESPRFSLAGNMASAIVEILQSEGRCTPKDLFKKGFTPAVVTQYWHLAHSIASLQHKLMGADKSRGHKLFAGFNSLLKRA